MHEVARYARALLADDEMLRLRAMAGLTRYPHDHVAVAELMESAKNDLLGELSLVAAVALADMTRANPAVVAAVVCRYRETVGSVPLDGDHDPTLRLSYYFAIAGHRDWFRTMRPADVAPTDPALLARYLAAGRDGDVCTAARAMVRFESLHPAGSPRVFRAARRLLPGWSHWFRPLIRAVRGR